jgi:hypothetical protein
MEYPINLNNIDISYGMCLSDLETDPDHIARSRKQVESYYVHNGDCLSKDYYDYYKMVFEVTDCEKMGLPVYNQVTISFDTKYVKRGYCRSSHEISRNIDKLMLDIKNIVYDGRPDTRKPDYYVDVFEFYHLTHIKLSKIIDVINNFDHDIRNHVRIYLTKKIIVDTLYPVETCDEMQVDSICVEEPDEEITQINKKQKIV